MNQNKRNTHRLIMSVIMITVLSIFAVGCNRGGVPVRKIATTYACNHEVTLKTGLYIDQFASETAPGELDRGLDSTRAHKEWERLIVERSGFYQNHIPRGTVMLVPIRCSDPMAIKPQPATTG